MISASADPNASIVIVDLDNVREPYIFEMNKVYHSISIYFLFTYFIFVKGCWCFDYSKRLNMIVSGSTDTTLRLWNPYVTSNPTMKLQGHKNMILDVKIHDHFDYAYSFSIDGVNIILSNNYNKTHFN